MTAPANHDEMVALFRQQLELCKLNASETVAVLHDGTCLSDYATAFLSAAEDIGAQTIDVHLRPEAETSLEERFENFGANPLSENPEALTICKDADMVVDLFVASFSAEEAAIKEAGTRILLVCEEFDTLGRLLPTPELKARTEASVDRLRGAKSFRFTNAQGTDISYVFGPSYTPLSEYGYTDEAGRWDHWPGGLAAHCPEDKSVNGRVVMAEGDIIYPSMEFVRQPIEFTVENGRVTEIKGGEHADELRKFMDSYDDPRAYAISHIGWGLNEKCDWILKGIGMDGRAYDGVVLFSLGPNLEFGGDNDTKCHMDLPMRNCTAYLDGEMIIDNGVLLPDDLKTPA